MADPDDIWGEALQEAYAYAPSEDVILHTLELRHPSFLNEFGQLDAVRVVADSGKLITSGDPDVYGWHLTLEPDAPLNGGQSVVFVSCMFEFSLPEQKEGSLPSIEISIDNVSRELSPRLDGAIGLRAPIEITYREYLASDLGGPQFILPGLTLRQVRSTLLSVTGTAQFTDLINRSFPGRTYLPKEFRGLRS